MKITDTINFFNPLIAKASSQVVDKFKDTKAFLENQIAPVANQASENTGKVYATAAQLANFGFEEAKQRYEEWTKKNLSEEFKGTVDEIVKLAPAAIAYGLAPKSIKSVLLAAYAAAHLSNEKPLSDEQYYKIYKVLGIRLGLLTVSSMASLVTNSNAEGLIKNTLKTVKYGIETYNLTQRIQTKEKSIFSTISLAEASLL